MRHPGTGEVSDSGTWNIRVVGDDASSDVRVTITAIEATAGNPAE